MKIAKTITIIFLSTILLAINSCKKRSSGVLEVVESSSDGSKKHYWAIPVDGSSHLANTVERDDKYLNIAKSTGGRAFVYYWPDKSAAKLGYKDRYNKDDAYTTKNGPTTPGDNGYWKNHQDFPAAWEKDVVAFTNVQLGFALSYYSFLKLNNTSPITYRSAQEAQNNSAVKVNVESSVSYTVSGQKGFLDYRQFNLSKNVVEIVSENGKYKLLVNGNPAEVAGPTGGSGGSGITGTWNVMVCNGSKEQIWHFGSDGTGYFTNPDCNGICEPLKFPFTYADDGSKVDVSYTTPPAIKCTGYPDTAPPKPSNDSFTYTISGNDLNVTQGSKSFSFKRK